MAESVDTLVIGGGQAGLATGYYLQRAGRRFVILDDQDRPGAAWRARWDSLRLFTPRAMSRLPGQRHALRPGYPTKDEMARYLERYVRRHDLPIRHGVRVTRLSQGQHGFALDTSAGPLTAQQVVVATGPFHAPWVPPAADALAPSVRQMHSKDYQRPDQLQAGPVLVVGAGNSGAEIAMDAARAGHVTYLAGRDPGRELPESIGAVGTYLVSPVFWLAGSRLMRTDTKAGREMRDSMAGKGWPRVRLRHKDFHRAGIRRVPRVAGAKRGAPRLEDGRTLQVANVVWCTGFRPDFSWIDLPIFGTDGLPRHERGVVAEAPGLYFVGLHFQYTATSSLVGGVGRDAAHVVRHLTRRTT